MEIICLFGQSRESYAGEHAPELLLAWDEYSVEENAEGWKEAQEKALDKRSDLVTTRVIKIKVDQLQIRGLLLAQAPVLPGKVVL